MERGGRKRERKGLVGRLMEMGRKRRKETNCDGMVM